MTSFSFTEFLGIVFYTAWIMLQMCWFVVIPIMVASFYLGTRGGAASVWLIIALFIGGVILIPLTGEGGSGAIVYLGLPFVVPLYILPLYGIGQWIGRRKKKPVSKEIIEVR